MKKDNHFASRMLTLAGGLMTLSGILMAICTELAIGGVLWAAAACMFFSAYHFRIRENKEKEASDDESKTL